MLRILDYHKKYQNLPVLTVPELNLPNGIFSLKGTNGSGKSTLLKSLAGILHFHGNVLLNEKFSLKKDAIAYRTRVNFAPAEPIYPEFLTGYEMVKMFASAKSSHSNQAEKYISEMMMGSYIDDELGSYSSGMLKKLSLVLAFLGHPLLILLDEPLITIDTESLQILYSWIKERHQVEGCSFIIASHQILEAERLKITAGLIVSDQTVQFI
ncbi:ATP-binding cassette domain-containing protein [Pedobacter sp. JCM 36344]|uniref:ATP-binding cassette domain-containing protein n=1 Tax=Pedobacter sp. JCM 36344 TaxID=3374280 RepID=UPI00397C45E5